MSQISIKIPIKEWENEYLFASVANKSVFLICQQSISINKKLEEYFRKQ